jgi:uncharacterized RDD family membrane protein YckC
MSTDDARRASPFEDRLAIATPEGVEVELTLAGIGSRFIAAGIDFTIQILVVIALAVLLRPAGDAGFAVFTSVVFALIFFYDVLFEVLGRGRTPGKRSSGLRVVGPGGRPITLVRSAIRNILRIIDILPGFYGIGMTVIFITPRNQRIGDLVARTHVVRDRYADSSAAPTIVLPRVDTGPAATWDVSAVAADDVATVRAFLERRDALHSQARLELAGQLAGRLRPRVGGAPPTMGDETFLELLVAVKAERASNPFHNDRPHPGVPGL